MEKGSEGWQMSSLLLKEIPLAVYGFKKASLINDSFISEVKSRWRWKPRRRGGCLSPPRKLHGKEYFKMYLKDGPLRRSSECIGLHNVVPKRWSP